MNVHLLVDSSSNVMAQSDAWEGKWRGNWRLEWVASTLHTTSEHGVSSITTADAHNSAASSRLNWRPPADLNGLVRFAEKRNLVSAHVPSHYNWPLRTASNLWWSPVEMWWHMVTHGGKWRGNWRIEWVASTLNTISEHGVSSITTADAHTSAASSRFKWTRPFRRKTKSGFCACAITFQLACTIWQKVISRFSS